MGLVPLTPSFTTLSFVVAPNSLTGYSYLLHTLHVFVDMERLTFVQNIPLPWTHSSHYLSSSVCNLMRLCSIHLPPPAYGARRSPRIYPSHRIRTDRRPRRILSCMMHSIDGALWCLDATTLAASDDPPSQRWGWRGCYLFPSQIVSVKVG